MSAFDSFYEECTKIYAVYEEGKPTIEFAKATKEFADKVAAQAVEVERSRVLVRKTVFDAVHKISKEKKNYDDLHQRTIAVEQLMFDNHKCTLVELSSDYWHNFALQNAVIAEDADILYRLVVNDNLRSLAAKIEGMKERLAFAVDLNCKYHDRGAKKRTLEEMDIPPEVRPEDQPAIKDHALLRDAAKKLKAKHDAEVKSVAASLVEEMKKKEEKEEETAAAMAEEAKAAAAEELQRVLFD